MTAHEKIDDLVSIEVEHLMNAHWKQLVKIRVKSTNAVSIGALDPDEARALAVNLLDAAARADYERDMVVGLQQTNAPEDVIAAALHVVRNGEVERLKNPDD